MKEAVPFHPVVIEGVRPEIEGGRYAIKRVVGEEVVVEADVLAHGHEELRCLLLHRHESAGSWTEVPMEPLVNDRWRGRFCVERLGLHRYTLEAWVDPFRTWRRDLRRRAAAGQDLAVHLLEGAQLVRRAADRAAGGDAGDLYAAARRLEGSEDVGARAELALGDALASLADAYPDRGRATRYDLELMVRVEPRRARFSSWYEMFPRSCSPTPGRHGTFRDCIERLSYVAGMGFDVLYLPPIHPIGHTNRKGRNNALVAGPEDVGSPWAIGSEEGGHKAVHPELGALEDFRALVGKARELGIEVALDLAFQCSPDHLYVKQHPEWFRIRADGSIQHAENPPKTYEDIIPLDFATADWRGMWEELKSVVLFWMEQGIKTFRVDNPHTKPFAFWEWLIAEVQRIDPEVIFLSEAFTRPKIMYRLAKLGFSQSYTYFAWRNTRWELEQYFTELTRPPVGEFFRPSLWVNTPDILTEYLQFGGRAAFMVRLVLAATLGANYGIYGPACELLENRAREPGLEEYLDSEKYQLRHWDLDRPDSLRDFIALLNRIRRENAALQSDRSLRFHPVDNPNLICYSKSDEAAQNLVLVIVNLDPYHTQAGWLSLPLEDLGLDPMSPYQAHDLLTGARFLWSGARNYVELDPQSHPAHVLRLLKKVRTEQDFDYYF